MMWQNSHATVVERVENRVGKRDTPKGCPDIVVSQKINGTSRYETGETCRTYPVRFALVQEGDGVGFHLQRIGNRCGFPVVKCLSGRAGDEAGEILHPSTSKLHESDSSRSMPGIDRCSVVPAGLDVAFKLQNDL